MALDKVISVKGASCNHTVIEKIVVRKRDQKAEIHYSIYASKAARDAGDGSLLDAMVEVSIGAGEQQLLSLADTALSQFPDFSGSSVISD